MFAFAFRRSAGAAVVGIGRERRARAAAVRFAGSTAGNAGVPPGRRTTAHRRRAVAGRRACSAVESRLQGRPAALVRARAIAMALHARVAAATACAANAGHDHERQLRAVMAARTAVMDVGQRHAGSSARRQAGGAATFGFRSRRVVGGGLIPLCSICRDRAAVRKRQGKGKLSVVDPAREERQAEREPQGSHE
jgi:hypothetical protein